MDCDKTLGERLAKARDAAGLSQQAVADEVLEPSEDGTHRKNTIYEWEKDKFVPKADALAKLVALYGINGHWLLTGQGDMELREPEKDAVWVAVIGRIVGDQIDMATLKRLAGDEAMTREAREVQRKIKAETARQNQSGGAA